MPVNYSTDAGQVRLLINDTTDDPVFSEDEVAAFLSLEGGSVKLAAALALETIANDEALTSKVIRSQDLSTDGAAVAQALRDSAARLRTQAAGALSPRGSFPEPTLTWVSTTSASTLRD